MILESFPILHKTNILIHVTAGCLALIVGVIALIARKGKKTHEKSGKIFLFLLSLVILTGLFGVFVFKLNTFLLVITVLSGYTGFSGYRTLQTKSNKPVFIDILVAIAALCTALYFIYYFKSIGMIWALIIIYSTMGYLIFMISYDFLRYLIPTSFYEGKANLWLYEHILKMISAFSALLSAFSGTVFSQYLPYSQFLPSVFGFLTAIAFMITVNRKKRLS